MATRITEGYFARHYRGNQSRIPALLDVGQDHALQILHARGLFAEGLVFKGGTALRKFRAGSTGRFSTDLDFAVGEPGLAELVMETLHGADLDDFRFTVDVDVPQRRATLNMETPFGVPAPPARIDITCNLPWLQPEMLAPIALPIHARYNFVLPRTPVIRIEELIAEKLARFHRASLARDLYDLFWFSDKVFNEALVRRLTVLKIWRDIAVEGLSNPPFDPNHLLRQRRPGDYRMEAIGTLTVPVAIEAWEARARARFAFVRNLDAQESPLARALLREQGVFEDLVAQVRAA